MYFSSWSIKLGNSGNKQGTLVLKYVDAGNISKFMLIEDFDPSIVSWADLAVFEMTYSVTGGTELISIIDSA